MAPDIVGGARRRFPRVVVRADSPFKTINDLVEAAWRIAQPILDTWAAHPPEDFPNYPAGTWGPKEAFDLIERDVEPAAAIEVSGIGLSPVGTGAPIESEEAVELRATLLSQTERLVRLAVVAGVVWGAAVIWSGVIPTALCSNLPAWHALKRCALVPARSSIRIVTQMAAGGSRITSSAACSTVIVHQYAACLSFQKERRRVMRWMRG